MDRRPPRKSDRFSVCFLRAARYIRGSIATPPATHTLADALAAEDPSDLKWAPAVPVQEVLLRIDERKHGGFLDNNRIHRSSSHTETANQRRLFSRPGDWEMPVVYRGGDCRRKNIRRTARNAIGLGARGRLSGLLGEFRQSGVTWLLADHHAAG